ncbi:MAG: DASS family sodium-coupled anion symporter [Candidatus Aminicenantes bacterium]|nr:DASS family sodium-coupled anion symporter [Candidatus Aminicenantes bacterium]
MGDDGRLPPGEARFEHRRKTLGLILGPATAVLLASLPMPSLAGRAHALLAVIGWVVVWWVTEPVPLPVSAMLGAVLCVLFGITTAKAAFAAFSDPIIFLFLGSFLLAEAMTVHGLDKRFAYAILSLGWVGRRSGRVLLAFGFVCAFLSMWISNTATTAMMMPIGVGIVGAMASVVERDRGGTVDPRRLRFGTGMMLMTAYAASSGGIGTPVGTPPNLIGIALIEKAVGVRIPFFQWMLFAVPLLVLMSGLLFLLMIRLHKPEVREIEGSAGFIKAESRRLGPWTRGQKNALAAFAVAVLLWTGPGFIALVGGAQSAPARFVNARIPEGAAALLAALLLFIIPIDWKTRTFTLSWKQAMRIDWGTLLLFGGGITLGELMFQTGLADAVGRGLVRLSGADSLWGLTLAAVFVSIVVSEATSNTASANMVVPVVISVSMAAGLNPLPPAVGATLGASWGFMLPVSTPPNAIVYGSGMVPITKMIRAGFLFDILGGLVIWVGLRLLLPLVGLA